MSEASNLLQTAQRLPRLPVIDTMRGIVMMLMAMDHASHAFNAHRYTADSFINNGA
jgi:uncharacterized membrane protein